MSADSGYDELASARNDSRSLPRAQVTATSAHGTKGGTDRVRPAKVAKAAAASAAPTPTPTPPPKAGAWGDDLSYQQWDMHSIFVPRTHAHNIKGKGVKVSAAALSQAVRTAAPGRCMVGILIIFILLSGNVAVWGTIVRLHGAVPSNASLQIGSCCNDAECGKATLVALHPGAASAECLHLPHRLSRSGS